MGPTLPVDAVIAAAAIKAKVTPEQARATIAASLALLKKHAAGPQVEAVFAALEGGLALATSPEAAPKKSGFLGGLMKTAGGASGAVVADAMSMMDRLKKLGLDRVAVKRLLRSVRAQVQMATGQDLVGDALRTVPGVGAMLVDD